VKHTEITDPFLDTTDASQALMDIKTMRISAAVWLILIGIACPGFAGDLIVDTVAGTGTAQNNGDAGAALGMNIGQPFGVTLGPDGALYICEVQNHRIRRLDLKSGKLTTVAGNGEQGYSGDGGPATKAKLNEPYEVLFDKDGNMIFVEMRNHVVRRVDKKTRRISTIAGTGQQGFSGDGGPATKAKFNQPHSIALDGKGALYIADIGNHRIRRVDPEHRTVETIAGNSQRRLPVDGRLARGNPILGPRALFIDGENLWIGLREGNSIWRMRLDDGILHHVAGTGTAGFSGDGGPALEAKLSGPKGIAVDAAGNVLIADTENNVIRKIDRRSGVISTVAGGRPAGTITASQTSNAEEVRFNRPHGICVAPNGVIFVGDTLNHRVARVH
jgi:DNA-binding beta-propeller fold protein YncE